MKKNTVLLMFLLLQTQTLIYAQSLPLANKPARVAWYQDLAFGQFIHWNLDGSLGAVISHSLAASSEDYAKKYFEELPRYFNPAKFNPAKWAQLARLAGMKYVVFTAKHHSGFCMWDTRTTPFNVMNTPFKRDILKELVEAYRKEGIAIGLYFSPEDFHYFFQHQIPLGRLQHPQHYPVNNAGLMEYDQRQLKELFTNYGKIDLLFIDGPAEGLKEYAWSLDPDVVVTRGAMNTPEQTTPNQALPRPWESCYTMGTDWGYKPTNDPHKTGTQVINMLIEIRAKGGNFLLNVGPTPDGDLLYEEEAILREVALWNFANGESIYQVKPQPVIKEENCWYTSSNDGKTIYASITRSSADDWKYGERKNLVLTHVEGNEQTRVDVLGFNGQLVEYKKDFDAATYIASTPIGLVISAVNGQRFYTNNKWPNAVVLRIKNARFKTVALGEGKGSQSQLEGAK